MKKGREYPTLPESSPSGSLQPRLAAGREDRHSVSIGRAERQLVEVVASVESPRLGAGIGVGIDLRAEDTSVSRIVEDLQPARTAGRNDLLETRRGARERVRQTAAELASAADREAEYGFSIVKEQAEQGSERGGASGQVAVDAVDDDQRVVAISAARNAVRREHSRNLVIAANRAIEVDVGSG